MNCGHRCHEIGGPWIAEDPDCPVHGVEALRLAKIREAEECQAQRERDALLQRVAQLEARVTRLENRDRRLRAGVFPG